MNRRIQVLASAAGVVALLAGSTPSLVAAKGLVDISATAAGRDKIAVAAASFAAQGSPVADGQLVADSLPDGSIVVLDRAYKLTTTSSGLRVAPADSGTTVLAAQGAVALAASQSWSQIRSGCFAALFRGAAHFDVCHKQFKMLNDGDGGHDYWRVDFYGTMFSEGRTLDWGWIALDRDAGPPLSFVDWAPDQDYDGNCEGVSLGLSVAGFGISQGGTFCELVDISKSAGASVGFFKEQWSWGSHTRAANRDRAVKMLVGFSSTQGGGTPVWGMSWDFAAHG